MIWLIIIIIAISLSMDAFSLALAYGTLKICKKDMVLLSIIVGIYHFFMPLIGMEMGSYILNVIKINPNVIVFMVLLIIGINMIIDSFKNKKEIKVLKKIELFVFGLAVSIDSFSVGISLKTITNNYLLTVLIFSLSSFIFTYLGLTLGHKIASIYGKVASIIGGSALIIIGILYLFK